MPGLPSSPPHSKVVRFLEPNDTLTFIDGDVPRVWSYSLRVPTTRQWVELRVERVDCDELWLGAVSVPMALGPLSSEAEVIGTSVDCDEGAYGPLRRFEWQVALNYFHTLLTKPKISDSSCIRLYAPDQYIGRGD